MSIPSFDEPIIQLTDDLINRAIELSISDIHFEPFEQHCRIRYRQNGLLQEVTTLSKSIADRVITRLKVIAQLDISEKRIPQDGRLQHATMDMRINTCPTLHGEKIVLRLFHQHLLKLNELGMNEIQKKLFIHHLNKPNGLILVTGPTGSGKTMTLYTALHYLNTIDKNILTAEDPIEIQLPGINQVAVNNKIDLTFSALLKTFLRQDPDIMMLGEIRDRETAEIAIQASQTGHLVLSTLHTNNTTEAITRLLNMGIPAFQLAHSVSLIIAQRLVRTLCSHCKASTHHCSQCSNGYNGRTGIFEFLAITKSIAQVIGKPTLLNIAMQEGLIELKEHGQEKILQEITTLSELNRVLST